MGRGEGLQMKAIARSLVVIFVALIAVPALAVTQSITTAVQLLAATTTALIVGGTQHSLSPDVDDNLFVTTYMGQAVGNYLDEDGVGAPVTNRVAVTYPAQF